MAFDSLFSFLASMPVDFNPLSTTPPPPMTTGTLQPTPPLPQLPAVDEFSASAAVSTTVFDAGFLSLVASSVAQFGSMVLLVVDDDSLTPPLWLAFPTSPLGGGVVANVIVGVVALLGARDDGVVVVVVVVMLAAASSDMLVLVSAAFVVEPMVVWLCGVVTGESRDFVDFCAYGGTHNRCVRIDCTYYIV